MTTERQEKIVRNIVKFSAFLGDPEQLARLLDAAKSAKMANIVITRPESEGASIFRYTSLGKQDTRFCLAQTACAESSNTLTRRTARRLMLGLRPR